VQAGGGWASLSGGKGLEVRTGSMVGVGGGVDCEEGTSRCSASIGTPHSGCRKGLTFVSVHDCFWTHAADVGVMNQVRPCAH